MIHFENKQAVIDAYEEIGRPLDRDLLDSLESVDAELASLGLPRKFVVINLHCRICNHEQAAIAPAVGNVDDLECINCGNMTCQEKEPNEWES